MDGSTARRHAQWRLVTVLVAITAAMAACAPPGGGGSTPPDPPWLAAGCLDNPMPMQSDVFFNGTPNQVGNVTGFMSTDGTCTDPLGLSLTLVQAPDATAAQAICTSLGIVGTASAVASFGYPVPADAFACLATPPPAWLEAGCYDSSSSGLDLNAFGLDGVANNAELISTDDGSCSGIFVTFVTIVQADDLAGAELACTDAGQGLPPHELGLDGYSVPADAWICAP